MKIICKLVALTVYDDIFVLSSVRDELLLPCKQWLGNNTGQDILSTYFDLDKNWIPSLELIDVYESEYSLDIVYCSIIPYQTKLKNGFSHKISPEYNNRYINKALQLQ